MRPTDPHPPSPPAAAAHAARADAVDCHPRPGGGELSILCDTDTGERLPLRSRLLLLLPVAEAITFGLVARHAYDEGTRAAVWLTLTFLFLVPMAAGYQRVALSDEPRVGALTPSAFMLMLLTAGVAQSGPGVAAVVLLAPMFMLMALIGGVLALLVRALRRVALRVAGLITRGGADPRTTWRRILPHPAFAPRAEAGR